MVRFFAAGAALAVASALVVTQPASAQGHSSDTETARIDQRRFSGRTADPERTGISFRHAIELASSAPSPVPAYSQDFPDPFVLLAGSTYYAYSTQVGDVTVPVMSSPDLASWSAVSNALPLLPTWANGGRTWAPTVAVHGTTYVLYYTVWQKSSGRQCVSVAASSNPAGPFVDSSAGPLVCQLTLGGSIDPYAFTDPSGVPYLIWKSDNNALGRPTSLWGQRLAPNGLAFATGSSPVQLLTQSWWSPWQAPAVEGPAMMAWQGTYYLFYGGGNWSSSSSAIGYATCKTPLGPCRDRTSGAPWFGTAPSGAAPVGPQGPTVFTDLAGHTRLGFAGWADPQHVGYDNGGKRTFWIGTLSIVGGRPVLG